MTDNEIIKALSLCANENGVCSECAYSDDYTNCNTRIAKDALDLINRQKAEIEKLKDVLKLYHSYNPAIKHARTEATKDFAKEIKNKLWDFPTMSDDDGEYDYVCIESLIDFIDKYVKEKVGDNE